MKRRRQFLSATAVGALLAGLGLRPARAAQALPLGEPLAFTFDSLVARAGDLAAQPYQAPPPLPAEVLERIDYETHGKIHFKTERALFVDGPGAYPVTFFHLGRYFRNPVYMHVVEAGAAREILYAAEDFDMPADSPARELPPQIGFAGFRVQESRLAPHGALDWRNNDWVAFLGASYFRAIGELYQYGMSARGVAVDTAVADRPEEFPAFTHVYFETPSAGQSGLTLYALLQGPGVTGAYRFVLTRSAAVLIEVEARLFLRRDLARLGLAPLTSMYWYSETMQSVDDDWRPEVHDSDGLALWTGNGERIWRPLNNPPQVAVSVFLDRDPRGFGLLQRDRNFDHYQDGVHYERRPSVWVEPLDPWGAGSVQLVEIPTDRETMDNVVAMWVPQEPARAGTQLHLRYRLHWRAEVPDPGPLARCVATRLGVGGQPGQARQAGATKFVVEFLGGPLGELPYGVLPQAVLSAGRGRFADVFVEAVPDGVVGHWRAQFDLSAEGSEPVELRLYLKSGERALTETWLYRFYPGYRGRAHAPSRAG